MVNRLTHAAADVTVENEGTVVLFVLKTEAARKFVIEKVATERWQWLGSSLAVEARYAGDLITGMVDDGLTVE